jgi:predicted RNase H-like HicB family nuclease
MYRVWYWAMIGRESDGRFIASIPDLGDLAAYGDTDKDAVALRDYLSRNAFMI